MLYDYIITGCGLGGLSFAYHLLEEQPQAKLLLLDKELKESNDRTWSFWSKNTPPYPNLIHKSWKSIGFASPSFGKYENIDPYQYYTIQGIDFYQFMKSHLLAFPNVKFERREVQSINDLDDTALVKTNLENFQGRTVIDSLTKPIIPDSSIINFQNFVGWRIKTSEPAFDADKAMLMDFRVPQSGSGSFIYLLPYSSDEALIEFTQFDTQKYIHHDAFEDGIQRYLKEHYDLEDFKIVSKEAGSIPMTDHSFDHHPSKNVYRIGTIGGDTKATSGYTFLNVQDHAKQILLQLKGHTVTSKSRRFAFYDHLLLDIMSNESDQMLPIFQSLFKQQPYSRVLKFLNEDTSAFEEALIFSRMKWSPFLKAIFIPSKKYELASA